jgi:hypothetical protein
MRITTPGVAERRPHRSRLDHPDLLAGSFRRGELAAGLAAVAVVAQLALAPVTLLVAGLLVLAGRIARWQLAWLVLPAFGGVCWLAVAGLPAAARALTAGAGRLMAAELAVAAHPKRLLHPAAAFAGSVRWLPQELPLLVLAGTAEAAIVLWLGTVLSSGSGLWPGRFQLAGPRSGWQPLTGSETPPGRRPGLVAVLRRRTAVAALAAGHTVTASGCAIGVDYYSGRLAAVSWAQAERGVLLAGGDPIELNQIGLAIACAAVRRRKAVLVLEGSAAGAGRERSGPDRCGASVCAQVARLAERVGVPVTCIGSVADRAPAVPGAAAVPGAGTSGTVSRGGAFGRAIRGRSVVLVPAHQPDAARQAVSDLVGTLTGLRELGLRGDCLAWVSGCEAADVSRLSALLALGHATGTAVLLSTTSPGIAAELAVLAGLVVASGPITDNLAELLADLAVGSSATAPAMGHELPIDAPLWASIGNSRPTAPESVAVSSFAKLAIRDILRSQHRGSASMIDDNAPSGPASFRIVPVEVTEVR